MLGLGHSNGHSDASTFPILNQIGVPAVFAFSFQKLKAGILLSSIIRRSIDSALYSLGFDAKGNMDLPGLKSFLGMGNLLSLYSPYWSWNSGYATSSYSNVNGVAHIDIENANSTTLSATISNTIYNLKPGATIVVTYKHKTSNMYARCAVNSSPNNIQVRVATSETSEGVFTTQTFSFIVPVGGTVATLYMAARAINLWDTGYVEFKDLTITHTDISGYVTTLLDQSGNGLNAGQAIAANQPRIVNNGVLEVDNKGNPCLNVNYTIPVYMSIDNHSLLQFTNAATINFVHSPVDYGGGGYGRILDKNGLIDYCMYTATTTKLCGISSGLDSPDGCIVFSGKNINTLTHDSIANETKVYLNGSIKSSKLAFVRPISTNNLFLFNRADAGRQYNGTFSELILFNKTLTNTQRLKLERNQGKRHGITIGG